MNKLAVNANTLWLYAVLVHIAGSIVADMMVILPFGSVLFMTVLWVTMFFLVDKNKKYRIPFIAGWMLSLFVLYNIPSAYEKSLLLNGLVLLLIFYVCRAREVKPTEFCHIKKIPVKQWGLIFLITVALIVIAGYVNGISMLFFYNGTTNSLQKVGKYFPESVIVFALIPALSEELLFRGCIFQEIAGTNKKEFAIFLSAVLFALLHMNFNQMCYAFVMGLFFGWIVAMTNNLSVSILIHGLFNCFSVFTYSFPEHFLIKHIMNLHVGDYYIFNPTLRDVNGMIMGQAVLQGALLSVCMLIFVGALLYLLKKYNRKEDFCELERKNHSIEESNSSVKWKPDHEFWAGCISCIIVAVLYELGMKG